MASTAAAARMFRISKTYCLPLMLVLNYAMLQYLITVYVKRWREFRVRMLLFAAFVGSGALLTFSDKSESEIQDLNDASEMCLQLTFLIQITIIGRDVQVKVKDRAIQRFTLAAELLIAIGWFNICASFVSIAGLSLGHWLEYWLNITETLMVVFVTVFRFYYLSISKSLVRVLRRRKTEVVAYLLLITHEYPWLMAGHLSGLSLEYFKGVYMRLIIASCIVLNIHKKAVASLDSSQATTRAPRSVVSRRSIMSFQSKKGPDMSSREQSGRVGWVKHSTVQRIAVASEATREQGQRLSAQTRDQG